MSRGANRVAIGILLSRVFGLVRELAIGVALGVGGPADSFRFAMKVPNLLQNLLGEGSLSASFVPVYARLIEEKKHREAAQLASQIAGLLGALVVTIVAIMVIAARPLVWITTLGAVEANRFEKAVELTRFTAVGVGFLVLSAFCLGILNAHRSYLLSYSAPVVWSLAQIIVLLAAVLAGVTKSPAATWAVIGMVIGSIGQLIIQLPKVYSLGGVIRPQLRVGPDTKVVLRRFVPAVGGRGVVQLSSFLELGLASFLAAGAVSTIALVTPFYLLSISVFGFSVAVSELTEMSRAQGGMTVVAARTRAAMLRVLLPGALATAILIGAGPVVIDGLFGTMTRLGDSGAGRITPDQIKVAGLTLGAFSLGLPAAMTARVTQNTLYALGDVKGPARISLARLAIMAVAGLFLMIQADHLAVGTVQDLPVESELAESVYQTPLTNGPRGTIAVDGFPHWPLWEPLPNREEVNASNLLPQDRGTFLTHYGPVGIGLASAMAAWGEWALLRRRLRRTLGETISTGKFVQISIAGAVALASALACRLIPVPSLAQLPIVGSAALATYLAALRAMGLNPRQLLRT